MPGFNIPFQDACHEDGAFTGESAFQGPDYLIETARKHRYRLELMQANEEPLFGDDASGIILYCYKANRPSPEFDEIVIHNGQDEIYRPGKNRWKPIELTFYEILASDPIPDQNQITVNRPGRDTCARLLYRWWSELMLIIGESRHNIPTNYLAQGRLQMLDGAGSPVWEYNLLDCWPTKVTPSDVSYTDTGIADYSVTLRYQKAIEMGPI